MSVYIADGIEEIPADAFHDLINLETVELPKSVTTICKRAFYGCESLIDVNLSHVMKIESKAFSYCTALSDVSLNKNVECSLDAFSYTEFNKKSESDIRNESIRNGTAKAASGVLIKVIIGASVATLSFIAYVLSLKQKRGEMIIPDSVRDRSKDIGCKTIEATKLVRDKALTMKDRIKKPDNIYVTEMEVLNEEDITTDNNIIPDVSNDC